MQPSQSMSSMQRSSQQRRQQNTSDPALPPSQQGQPSYSASAPGGQPRASSGSGRSQRTINPDKQISQIEKSVTHLLVATKQLLETLTQWSRKQAQEEEVSDVYVRLGYEFNLACRAFNSIGVETTDLGPVPDLLRAILEDTLSQPASPQALDNYLPRIRDIIINLLHGLKRKQSKLRSRPPKDGATSRSQPTSGRQSSINSIGSTETGLTTMMDDVAGLNSSDKGDGARDTDGQSYAPANATAARQEQLPSALNRQGMSKDERAVPQSDSSSSMSSTTAQNIPVIPPHSDPLSSPNRIMLDFPHPPPPPPKQDALTALQRGGELERRASRRFSAYQIQKHLGASPNGVPVIPTAQHSPIPNRGRESRDAMTAVRSRTSHLGSTRNKTSPRLQEVSPSRTGTVRAPQRISEEREEGLSLDLETVPKVRAPPQPSQDDSPTAKTPEEFHRAYGPASEFDATLNGPLGLGPDVMPLTPQEESKPIPPPHEETPKTVISEPETKAPERRGRVDITPPQSQVVDLDDSPPQGKELTLFLQYKTKVKKFLLPEGYEGLTIARLQLAFIEKFNWNTSNNGVDLPEIYIQDPVSGVRHELEDLTDVKDRSVLVLNVEALDEVKKHFDDGLGDVRKTLESVRSLLDGQSTMMQRFSTQQLETSKEMARLSNVPTSRALPNRTNFSASTPSGKATQESLQEIQNLRRDIAVLRQSYSSMSSDFAAAMTDIKAKATNVKAVASDAARTSYEGNAGRAHINSGKKQMMEESESLVNRVDELTDVIEELRKDVVSRGVRPLPRQLEEISRKISTTTKDLSKMDQFIKKEKPLWTKIWEQELDLVCRERDDLTQQEELMSDLTGDIDDVVEVFKLVEEATKQQMQNGEVAGGPRSTSRSLAFETDVDPSQAKEGVLDEVRALRPNHESRLEAIERAEKARRRELESRKGGEFQQEVESFVEEGKLKKTGGMEEVERLRKIKDEQARKENWERQQAREAERERKAAEEAAAAAAASAAASVPVSAHGQVTVNGNEDQGSTDDSTEVETPFQDASETKIPPSEDATPQPQEGNHSKVEHANTGKPTVPTLDVLPQIPSISFDSEEGTKDEGSEDHPSTSFPNTGRSWWQPALFASPSGSS